MTEQSPTTRLKVDYNAHPAFAPYAGQNTIDSSMLDEVLQEIDTSFRLVVKSPESLSKHFINTLFSRQIDPLFNELKSGVQSMLKPSDFYYPVIPRALALAKNLLLQEVLYKSECKNLGAMPIRSEHVSTIGRDVATNGCGFLNLPREEIAKLWSGLQPLKPAVLANRAKTPWEIASTGIPQQGPVWQFLLDLLQSHGAFEALSQFHSCRVEPLHASLAHSCADEDWYRGCYADVGLPNSQCTYMHFDGSFHVPKIILYLVEVDRDNGVFSVIPRSQDLFKSYSEILIHKAMDLVAEDILGQLPQYQMHYRRTRYKVPELRRELMKLPNEFRGTSHFGEDVVDNTPLSRTLLARETICTSDKANCIMFDGAQNIHRGGLVQKGERWALQLSYKRPGYTLDRRFFPRP